ncbi:FGGY family carbohydrate kinase [Agromyces sp. LHK192]|uniref:FGGY family carbohydrate kinase n=1 Tax=Agromyces sp. LHK192 TaxID=2498704 RepID=UPI000FD6DF7E|nr:FGGY family carbohydrate kinase [Agromyces sp. LHK192]
MPEPTTRSDTATVVAVDQGTSSTKAVALDGRGRVVATAAVSIGQSHPRPGWVEQDATRIADSVDTALARITRALGDSAGAVQALGLSTQRESAVIWDRTTGEPLGPILGWQDRRTRERAQELIDEGHDDVVRRITGLPIDPMFSALKFEWLLDEVDPDRARSGRGEIALGTVDSWLVFRATGEHRIEAGNASRTQLMSLDDVDWSDELCDLFRVPRRALPRIAPSNEPTGPIRAAGPGDRRFNAVLADSHAALFAHGIGDGGVAAGDVKVTYGTGSSIMGLSDAATPAGLVRTLAWHDGTVRYAFEGNILSTGATLVWLSNLFAISPGELTALAEEANPDHGLELVPAFAGLAAPWWDEHAQAIISGLSLGTDRASLARAAVDSIALQIEDVLSAVDADLPGGIRRVFVDGGPTANAWLMQLQADFSQRRLVRSDAPELSAIGAGMLAGMGAGTWTAADLGDLGGTRTGFEPRMAADAATARRRSWLDAIARSRGIRASIPQHT